MPLNEKVIKNIVMTIDSGTKGVRAILFDDVGNKLGKSEIVYGCHIIDILLT